MKKIIYAFILLTLSFGACSSSDNDGEPQQPPHTDDEEPVFDFHNKRGIAYGFETKSDAPLLGEKTIFWAYNWGPDWDSMEAQLNPYGKDFCPMAWNANYSSTRIKKYKQDHPECKYLLAFNEPNLTDQANMSPQKAAVSWPRLKTLADELGLKIISPAMNYGTFPGYSDPIKWLDEFFELVPLSDIDGISVHCYMDSPSALKGFIEKFKKYKKPIWLTEFCAWPDEKRPISIAQQMNYMSEVLNYLESEPYIERYSWFTPRDNGPYTDETKTEFANALVTEPSKANKTYELSELGIVYVNMSTLDKTVYYTKDRQIPAGQYCAVSGNLHLRLSTDSDDNILEICDFTRDHWVEYQLNAPQEGNYKLGIRYSTYMNSQVELTIDGEAATNLTLPNTNKAWSTLSTNIRLKKDKQTLRFKIASGNIALNWLRFSNESN